MEDAHHLRDGACTFRVWIEMRNWVCLVVRGDLEEGLRVAVAVASKKKKEEDNRVSEVQLEL